MKATIDNTKPETYRKQCTICGRTRTYLLRMKESRAYIPLILWQEYENRDICGKCFASIEEA
jgi:hypothetical protein